MAPSAPAVPPAASGEGAASEIAPLDLAMACIAACLVVLSGCSSGSERTAAAIDDGADPSSIAAEESPSLAVVSSGDSPPYASLDPDALRRFERYVDATAFDGAWRALHAERPDGVPPTPDIDFSAREVLGVYNGFEQDVGHAIGVERTVVRDDELIVTVEIETPGPRCFEPYLNDPYQLVSVPRFDGNVVFATVTRRGRPCHDDLGSRLDIAVDFTSDATAELTWTSSDTPEDVLEYRVEGDSLSSTTTSETALVLDRLVAGLYQRVAISPVSSDGQVFRTTELFLNPAARSGLRREDVGAENFAEAISAFASDDALTCPAPPEDSYSIDVLGTRCAVDAFVAGRPLQASALTFGVDSYSGAGAVLDGGGRLLLFGIEGGLFSPEFTGFECRSPEIVGGSLVCADCRGSSDARCGPFSR